MGLQCACREGRTQYGECVAFILAEARKDDLRDLSEHSG